MKETKSEQYSAVLVTTAHKGVFFGYAKDAAPQRITLCKARMCVYWSEDLRGVLGLASSGPSKTCRISNPVDEIVLNDVTAVVKCSPQAIEKWEQGPWQ